MSGIDAKYRESLGYRVNADKPQSAKKGFVTVYAERRNKDKALGFYGGDTYPVVYENENGAGFVLDADGLGNGGFKHPSLERYLEENTPKTFTDNGRLVVNPRDDAKLSLFLRKLYGKEIFDPQYNEVFEYALKCFSPVPTDGYFASEVSVWNENDPQKSQVVLPFYKRDSQSLGSRIICVGLYKTLFEIISNSAVMSKPFEEIAKHVWAAADKYIVDLKPVINELFDIASDADSRTIGRYVLPNTVAFWFYKHNEKNGSVNAVAVSVGDARCYTFDLIDGVRQISVDDAVEDGDISSLIHYGNAPKNDDTHFDNKFRARMVELEYPCALVACSDGIYDTCPNIKRDWGMRYGDINEVPSDIMFEKNLIDALRECYSYDDFKRKIVFEFYAQSMPAVVDEMIESGGFMRTKRDDSGTLAARFFETKPFDLFDALREKTGTTLDKLYEVIIAAKREGINVPYKQPHVESQEERDESKLTEVANKLMSAQLSGLLTKYYEGAFADMKAAGATTMWGLDHANENPLKDFGLNQFVKRASTKLAVLKLCLKDWAYTAGGTYPLEWKDKRHEHIVMEADIHKYLKESGFDGIVTEMTSGSDTSANDILLELYEWFENRFYGKCNKKRDELWTKKDGARMPARLDEIKGISKMHEQELLSVKNDNDANNGRSADRVTAQPAVSEPDFGGKNKSDTDGGNN